MQTPDRYAPFFRPVVEHVAASGWAVAACAALTIPQPSLALGVGLGCLGIAGWRGYQAATQISIKVRLSNQFLETCSGERADAIGRAAISRKGFYVGQGFDWTPEHAQRAFELLNVPEAELNILPKWMGCANDRLLRLCQPESTIPLLADKRTGVSWIHGMEEEHDLVFPMGAMEGHTFIAGTTGSGKTRLYEWLTMQAIQAMAASTADMGAVIIIDPKNDDAWRARVKKECERNDVPFLYFSPAYPSKSVRINPIANWANQLDIGARIANVLGANDSFGAFGEMTMNQIVNGMLMVGDKPDLRRIYGWVRNGVGPLLERCLDVFLREKIGPDWDKDLGAYQMAPGGKAPADRAMQASMFYQDWCKQQKHAGNQTIADLISVHTHNKEHFSKMILALTPLLVTLTSGEVGEMLSPNETDLTDERGITDMWRVITGKRVLYMGLDALSNKTISGAVGSMALADLASVAGAIYNMGTKADVYLFVDEASEVVNDQFIQLLNKGRGAGFKIFFATQVDSDFEAALESQAKARQVFGNQNNMICLRVRDPKTAEWLSECIGDVQVRSVSYSAGSSQSSEKSAVEFGTSAGSSLGYKESRLVRPELLLRLPNLQYFAMLTGGRIIKGRLPLMLDG